MTEEEKRALALQIMEQEAARLRSRAVFDANAAKLKASLARTARERHVLSNLAQNGITWDQLREAYHSAFKAGHNAMLTFKLSFFYAGSAIAFHEAFGTEAEQTAAFIQQM